MTEQEKYQKVVFEDKSHEQLLKGATILTRAVQSTMGPSGHSVIIDVSGRAPLITKDGVTVAKSINLKNNLESIGAELLKEIASKTNELAGDGTTTATVLGHGLLSQGIKMIATGHSSIGLKKGIDLACAEVISFLKENCVPIGNKSDVVSVGTISANGDRKIGELLADAIEKVGADGIITVEPAKSIQTSLDVSEGMQFESGYVSPFFISNSEKLICELRDPYILITNRKISVLGDIVKPLELAHMENKGLLIIADEIDGEALHTLTVNKMKLGMQICAVKAPSFGENRTDILQDIATVVGGQVIDMSSEVQIKNVTKEHFGTCKKVIVGRNMTTLIGMSSNERKEAVENRVASLKKTLLDKTLDDLRVDRYRKRLAKLSGGVAIVRVGGSTEVEILERKDRVEDALNATIAAVAEGIVPGGGTALFYAAAYLREMLKSDWETLPDDVTAGVQVVANACEMPLRVIVGNTGVSPDVVISKLLETFTGASFKKTNTMKDRNGKAIEWVNPFAPKTFKLIEGYDAANHKYTNLIDSGIIDPVKVTRYALEHACSVVGLMLTCNCVITEETLDKKEQ